LFYTKKKLDVYEFMVKQSNKDFAEVQAPQAMPQKAGRAQITAVVGGMMVIVAAGFAGGFMLGQEQGRQKANQAEKQRLLEQIGQQRQELDALKKETEKHSSAPGRASTQVGDLTFYNTLPRQSVTPAPLNDARQPAVSGSTPSSKGGARSVVKNTSRNEPAPKVAQTLAPGEMYRLQLGSYHLKANAGHFKAQLEQAGFPAKVQEMQLPGLGLWYRVYAGPYASLTEAENARTQVQAKLHITGLLLRAQ